MRERQEGTVIPDEENDILQSEEMMQKLITLAKQTDEGKIQWTCTKYLPMAFHLKFPSTSYGDADISQTLAGKADFQGQTLDFSITETINLPSEKGDIYIEMCFLDDEAAMALSYECDYDICPANHIRKKYGNTPIALFANAVIPMLVKENNWITEQCVESKFFREEDNNPKSLTDLSVVRTARSLCTEGRALDFHRMVLDTNIRGKLGAK